EASDQKHKQRRDATGSRNGTRPAPSRFFATKRTPALLLRQGFGVKNTFQATGDLLLDRNQIGKSWHSAEQSGLWNELCARQNGDGIAKKIKPRSSEEC